MHPSGSAFFLASRQLILLLAIGVAAAMGHAADEVFTAPPAVYETAPPRLVSDADRDVLRWIWVEERMYRARQQAPVRVPVFLAAGECGEPSELAIVRWPSREPVALQCDDVRRGSDGGVARLHVWFVTDLAPGESQRWALIRRGSEARPPASAVSLAVQSTLKISAGGTTAEFFPRPGAGGVLAGLQLADGPVLNFPRGAGPLLTVSAAPGSTGLQQTTVTCGTGPVFAKVKVVRTSAGISLTQNYRLFGNGSLNIIQTIESAAPTGLPAVSVQTFLSGDLPAAQGLAVTAHPAGIVAGLENFHPGFAVDSLQQTDRPRGWLIVPGTVGGTAGRAALSSWGSFSLQAPAGFVAGRVGQRAYWSEVTWYPAAREEWKAALLAASQPLVGVVERPGMTAAIAAARVRDNVQEMKPVGWVNEAVSRSLQGKPQPFPARRWAAEADPEHWIAAARRAQAKLTADGEKLREDEKGSAAGPLDPYHITYGSTPLVAWLWRDAVPAPALASVRAQLQALRVQLGRTDAAGTPYLDVFNRAQNMQMGPALLAVSDAGLNPALRQFYRAQLATPVLKAVLPRGLRPYEGRPQKRPDESDTIYQAVVDFMLRASELATGESLGLQPVALGRYLDTVDVTADLFHPAHLRSADDARHFARANFFRAQSHQHRWLSWGPAPFLALLRAPLPGEEIPGATEAWQFADQLAGRWKNWPDQSWLYLASELDGSGPRRLRPEPVAVAAGAP